MVIGRFMRRASGNTLSFIKLGISLLPQILKNDMARRCGIRLFDSCISKDDTAQSQILHLPAPADPFPLPPPPPHIRLAPVVSSSGFCCRRPARRPNLGVSADFEDLPRARETPVYLWRKEEKWHVVSCGGFTPSTASAVAASPRHKIDSDGSDTGIVLPPAAALPNDRRRREVALRQRRRNQRKKPQPNFRLRSRQLGSSSSADANCLFSSEEEGEEDSVEEEEEEDLLISSKSNSTTDSSFDQTELRRLKAAVVDRTPPDSSPWMKRKPRFQDVGASEVDGVTSKSLAVVKQSEDPRADFRQSMAEMVVEKGIYDVADLEELLHCFLSLNSEHHHRSIVAAFQDVWEAIFPTTPLRRNPVPGHHSVVY
ncbi:hypothetical protein HPP92_023323 [Vanilla planifolia]|uniref:Transcription repressor n=1 Tax=Vanilla planifolia TaxID=51239 RepID=A0A835UGM2_VANPL|nr:hypothetical protein HPP92_023653 [Vanilla planifolia]KAG0460195.1 hypothetical protein HPP92_023323 [Vanilla planifolia]